MKKIIFLIISTLFSFSLFSQDYTQVYLIGGATPNGWDNGKAQKMTLVESTAESAVLTWTGILTNSDFKFINSLNTWMPCFNAATANESVVLGNTHSLVYNTNNNAIDYKFIITEAATYTVTVDLKKLTMVVTKGTVDSYDNIWVTGSAIPTGTVKLGKKTDNLFIYGGELRQGYLKFMTTETPGVNTKYFVPVDEDMDITGQTTFNITNDASALGWYVTVDDPLYKMKVNTLNKTSTAEIIDTNKKYYIVGGATVAGWDAANAIELQQDKLHKSIYTFDGVLKLRPANVESNAFKFLGQLDWNPINLRAINANDPILAATYYAESINGSYADNKWIINENQQGRYVININVLSESIESQYIGNESAIEIPRINDCYRLNTTKNGVQIQMLNENSADSVQLVSLDGRVINSVLNPGKNFFFTNNGITGVYILKIVSNKNTFTQRVLIQ